MSEFKKRGLVKITNGKYEKDGVEKTRYVTVGEYFATDHANRQAIKLYATAFSDEKWLNIYLDKEDDRPLKQHEVLETTLNARDEPINSSDIPF